MVRGLRITNGETISCDEDRLALLDHVGEIADSFSDMMSKKNWVLPSPSTAGQVAGQVADEWVERKFRTDETRFFFFWQKYCENPQDKKEIIGTYLTRVFLNWRT